MSSSELFGHTRRSGTAGSTRVDPDVIAQAPGCEPDAEPDLRRGQDGRRPDREVERQEPEGPRLDPPIDDGVATQDTVTQPIAVIRWVRREVLVAAAVVADTCRAHDCDDPGKTQIAWDDGEARAVLVDALVRDALALLVVLKPLRPVLVGAQRAGHRQATAHVGRRVCDGSCARDGQFCVLPWLRCHRSSVG